MSRYQELSLAIFLALGVLIFPHSSLADYIGSNFGRPIRIHDDGTLAPPTYDMSNFGVFVEEPAQDVVLTPDLKIVYGLPNTLGAANVILAWDPDTGQRRLADDLNQGGVPYDQHIITGGGPTQPMIRNNELFAINPIYTAGSQNNNS